jgi:hypothetical protein
MREARHVALVLALICVAGLLAFLLWASRCPIEAGLETVDPSDMVDNSLIATVGISNPGNADMYLSMSSVRAEAKLANNWISVTNLWTGSGWVAPRGKTLILILMPRETEACRIQLDYSPQTARERLAAFMGRHAPRAVYNWPIITKLLWPQWVPGRVPPPRAWREASFTLTTPGDLNK